MTTKTKAPPMTEAEKLKADEEAAEIAMTEEVEALRPLAEQAVTEIQEAARILYAATETYLGVYQKSEEILNRRWGRRKRAALMPSMDEVSALRARADRTAINPPVLPLPRGHQKTD